ncbi:response regulator [Candidatus Woesearchaeota archaeon]|nr:response regulator [Candidatus Woesearchaeota archaeon]
MVNILIVEDQSGPLEALEFAVKTVFPTYSQEFHYDTARCYEDAQKMISNRYDFVLLDHQMPIRNVGNLEDTDFDSFTRSLKPVGYSLIDKIKEQNPKTVVIGTSSRSSSELKGQPAPDYVMSKIWNTSERDLDNILSKINAR